MYVYCPRTQQSSLKSNECARSVMPHFQHGSGAGAGGVACCSTATADALQPRHGAPGRETSQAPAPATTSRAPARRATASPPGAYDSPVASSKIKLNTLDKCLIALAAIVGAYMPLDLFAVLLR